MNRIADSRRPGDRPHRGLKARTAAFAHAILRFPFDLLVTILKRTAQVIFSIFLIILHPGFRWLVRLLRRSGFVRHYLRPGIAALAQRYYEPYFAFLARLPPFWAFVSIAIPLAVLEPAKVIATVLIVEHPRSGTLIWLFLQGLSLVLIDRTWAAVRPQSRKIWLVSRLHAWGWLNLAYGKYWITSSLFYKTLMRWKDQVMAAAQVYWSQLLHPRRPPRL
jgi:hypothetical protein